MAVIQPSSWGDLIGRAPDLNKQGAAFGQIPTFNAALAAKMAGDTMAAKANLRAIEAQGKEFRKLENLRRQPTMADRLTALAALLPGGGGSGGGFLGGGSDGNRFAGQALLGLLNQGSITPNQLLDDYNTTLSGLNLARAQIEPWSATSRKAAQGGMTLQ